MDLVGVEAVVEGLASFLGDVGAINGAIQGLKPPTNIIEQAFNSVTGAVEGFGRELLNVAETAMGVILRDAIEWVIRKLGDLASAAFDAAAEFQMISLRLQGFNLQVLVDSGKDFTTAMTEARDITRDQMSWVMKLAATTPYDATDIAYVFSMSEAFGFSADEAKTLTQNTLNFVAAMGLSGVEAKRVIINLGQMAQRGKITTREMNDLARGSLVPLADVLERVAGKMGITTGELTKLISKPGEGVDYQLFIDAFNEMTSEEVRFQDAGVRMAHTFKGAWENVTQTVRDVIGNFIILPGILDPLGQKLGDFMDTIGNDKNWEAITTAAQGVGDALGGLMSDLLDTFFPEQQSAVDGIVGALNSIKTWINTDGPGIITFLKDAYTLLFGGKKETPLFRLPQEEFQGPWANGGVGNNAPALPGVLTAIENIQKFSQTIVDNFDIIKGWVEENKPKIDEFITAIGKIIGMILNDIGITHKKGKGEGTGNSVMDILNGLKTPMQWVIDHQGDIANFISNVIKIWVFLNLIQICANLALGFLQAIIGLDFVAVAAILAGMSSSVDFMAKRAEDLYNWLVQISGWGNGGIAGMLGLGGGVTQGGGTGDTTDKGERDVSSKSLGNQIYNASSSVKHYNLNIVSNANSENLSADFSMLASMS